MQDESAKHLQNPQPEPPNWERVAVFVFGVTLIAVLLALVFEHPQLSKDQYLFCRIVLSLSAAAVATLITGFLIVEIRPVVRAGGAFGIFAITFFCTPATLPGNDPNAKLSDLGSVRQNVSAKNYDTAERQLRSMLRDNPDDREALNVLGSVYWKKGQPQDALVQFRKAADLATGEDRDRYLHNVAAAELKIGLYGPAATTLNDLLTRTPDDQSTQYNYGIAEAQLGHFPSARAIFTNLNKRTQQGYTDYRPSASLQLGLVDVMEGGDGSVKRAIAHFQDAVRIERPFDQLFLRIKTVIDDEDFGLESGVLDRLADNPEYQAFKTGLSGEQPRPS